MSLISSDELNQFKDAYTSFFKTFRQPIVVHKVSEIVVADVNLDQVFGYGEQANQENYTYEHESKEFCGLIVYPTRGDQNLGVMGEMPVTIAEGEIRIKVQEDCKAYIQLGKTEKIEVKNKSYTLISTEAEVNNLITGYYIFKLKEIK